MSIQAEKQRFFKSPGPKSEPVPENEVRPEETSTDGPIEDDIIEQSTKPSELKKEPVEIAKIDETEAGTKSPEQNTQPCITTGDSADVPDTATEQVHTNQDHPRESLGSQETEKRERALKLASQVKTHEVKTRPFKRGEKVDWRSVNAGFELFKNQMESIIENADQNIISRLFPKHFGLPNYLQRAVDAYFREISNEDSPASSQEKNGTQTFDQNSDSTQVASISQNAIISQTANNSQNANNSQEIDNRQIVPVERTLRSRRNNSNSNSNSSSQTESIQTVSIENGNTQNDFAQTGNSQPENIHDEGSSQNGTETASQAEKSGQEKVQELMQHMLTQQVIETAEQGSTTWKRYIGTLDVEAWATRSLFGRLTYLQPLEIRRLLPSKMKKSSRVAAKFGDSAIIRLYTSPEGREFGRLPEDITRILAPLIDLDIADFEAFIMMDTRFSLSIGDSFYVQIRCYLNNNTFAEHGLYTGGEEESAAKRQKVTNAAFNFSSETEGEAALRLKQRSISRLFERLRIMSASAQDEAKTIVIDDDSPSQHDTPEPTDDLNLDQLKQFYLSNQHSDYLENLPETTTPPVENFAMSLRPYQKHGLAWMLSREKEIDLIQELSVVDGENLSTQRMQNIREDKGVMNPLWKEFRWPKDRQLDGSVVHHENKSFYANLYNGEFSIDRPIVQNVLKGGILADEMGLGKTISTLALIHSVPYDSPSAPVGFRNYASKTTLIIVPMSLLSQWKSEFERTNNNDNHKCYVYYGDSVQADLSFLLCNRTENIPIVVITTYGVVQNEWTRINKMRDDAGRLPKLGLFSVEFFRIVLDEGHTIRNRTTKTAKSVHELESRRKWILTGTPVVNRLDDIFSLVKYLKLEPWSNFSYWKTFVTLPFEQKKFNQTLDVVKAILQPIFLRRTKNMKQKDGTPLVYLPDKEVVIQELEFSEKEQLYYDFFKSKAYQSFKEGMRTGELLKKYTQILTHILRLRQVCCHSDLIASSHELDETWEQELENYEKPFAQEKFMSEAAMKKIMYGLYKCVNIDDSECSICTSAPIAIGELTLTECGHQYCFHCLMDHIKYQKNEGSSALCPQCRHSISKHRLFKVHRRDTPMKEVRFHTNEEVDDPHSVYNFSLYHFNPDRSSAKIQALISHLRELKEQSPGESVVVFSQFSTFLDLIENEIKSLGTEEHQDFIVYKFDGRLSMTEREKILKKFTAQSKADGRITVLLLSLKAGGVGLNLTVARRVFMMDPWWSPSIEDQAIDRVHRIGQDHSVKVVRFIVKNSIELKMLRIQERKRKMGEAVEVEEEERRKQRIEEIKLLFDE
ncbi:hypothetical protein OXX79_000036 [Metschnikowia pulcherrima]